MFFRTGNGEGQFTGFFSFLTGQFQLVVVVGDRYIGVCVHGSTFSAHLYNIYIRPLGGHISAWSTSELWAKQNIGDIKTLHSLRPGHPWHYLHPSVRIWKGADYLDCQSERLLLLETGVGGILFLSPLYGISQNDLKIYIYLKPRHEGKDPWDLGSP